MYNCIILVASDYKTQYKKILHKKSKQQKRNNNNDKKNCNKEVERNGFFIRRISREAAKTTTSTTHLARWMSAECAMRRFFFSLFIPFFYGILILCENWKTGIMVDMWNCIRLWPSEYAFRRALWVHTSQTIFRDSECSLVNGEWRMQSMTKTGILCCHTMHGIVHAWCSQVKCSCSRVASINQQSKANAEPLISSMQSVFRSFVGDKVCAWIPRRGLLFIARRERKREREKTICHRLRLSTRRVFIVPTFCSAIEITLELCVVCAISFWFIFTTSSQCRTIVDRALSPTEQTHDFVFFALLTNGMKWIHISRARRHDFGCDSMRIISKTKWTTKDKQQCTQYGICQSDASRDVANAANTTWIAYLNEWQSQNTYLLWHQRCVFGVRRAKAICSL